MYVESSLPPVAVIKTPVDTVLTSIYTPCLATFYTKTPLTWRTFLGTGTITTCFLNTVFTVLSLGLYGKECLCLCIFITGTEDTQHRAAKSQSKQANVQICLRGHFCSCCYTLPRSSASPSPFLLSHFNMDNHMVWIFLSWPSKWVILDIKAANERRYMSRYYIFITVSPQTNSYLSKWLVQSHKPGSIA